MNLRAKLLCDKVMNTACGPSGWSNLVSPPAFDVEAVVGLCAIGLVVVFMADGASVSWDDESTTEPTSSH